MNDEDRGDWEHDVAKDKKLDRWWQEDKTYTCTSCRQQIQIPRHQVGGFWWLTSYLGIDGRQHSGGYCSSCFDKIATATGE
jgi:hypothetical protein